MVIFQIFCVSLYADDIGYVLDFIISGQSGPLSDMGTSGCFHVAQRAEIRVCEIHAFLRSHVYRYSCFPYGMPCHRTHRLP